MDIVAHAMTSRGTNKSYLKSQSFDLPSFVTFRLRDEAIIADNLKKTQGMVNSEHLIIASLPMRSLADQNDKVLITKQIKRQRNTPRPAFRKVSEIN